MSHSGGYPGFGSNMRWHPATGLAVIALGNGTYSPMHSLAELVLRALLTPLGGLPRGPGARPGGRSAPDPWPQTVAAADAVNALLKDWDDATADALFSENVALDRPYQERRADLALLRTRIGAFDVDAARPAESDTPAQRRWWLAGERGTVAVTIQLNPQRGAAAASSRSPSRSRRRRDSALARALATVTDWLNDGGAGWPASLPVAPEADAGLIARRLRMAAAWAGPVTQGAYQAGDGTTSVTVGTHRRARHGDPVPAGQRRRPGNSGRPT